MKINPFGDFVAVKAIVKIYQQAFGAEPWNEAYVCPVCKTIVPARPILEFCPECAEFGQKILLTEYWPTSKVISDFYSEMMNADAICVVVRIGKKIIGFAWGYKLAANPDIDQKLEAPGLNNLLDGGYYFYLDECAVAPAYQGQGFGKALSKYIFQEEGLKQILLRTKKDSRMYKITEGLGGEVLQNISRERVIMKLVIN